MPDYIKHKKTLTFAFLLLVLVLASGVSLPLPLTVARTQVAPTLLSPDYIEVLPTGDPEQDTTAIEKAVAALSFPMAGDGAYRRGTVRLSGTYVLTRPIVQNDKSKRVVAFDGQGHSCICVVKGFPADQYALTFAATGGKANAPLVRDLALILWDKCRGVRIEGVSYQQLVSGLRIDGAAGVGLRVSRCYGASIDNVTVSAKGVSLWLEFNSSLTHVKVGGRGTLWPAELPEDQRAAIVIAGGGTTLRDIDIESNVYGEYPLLWLSSSYSAIQGLRMENNSNTDCKIKYQGRGLSLSECVIGDSENLGAGGCRTFLQCVGTGGGVSIDNGLMMGFRESLVDVPLTWDADTKISRVTTKANVIRPDKYIRVAEEVAPPINES
jgi:hypothetical protein